jgi:ribosomal protein L35AE/L33A
MADIVASKTKKITRKSAVKQVRLWVRARFLGFRRYFIFYSRSKVQQNTNQSILRLEGVNDPKAAQYYFGKRVVYVYKTNSGQKDSRFRVIHYVNIRLSGEE